MMTVQMMMLWRLLKTLDHDFQPFGITAQLNDEIDSLNNDLKQLSEENRESCDEGSRKDYGY